ncbi:MAG: DHA2 family efflux MFS transporter permease subunit [Rhodomicrobium sp.]
MTAVPADSERREQERLSRSAAGGHNPWLIAAVVSIATFMEVLDVTIVNVSLDHIAGSLGTSYEESTWISTSYLVANAIVLPLSGWLATVIGRKRFYMLAVALFTASSVMCGLAWSLNSLILFRVLQGAGGGGLAPSEQSILADTFPPEKRGQAFALYGLAVVVAPAIGPTLGGYITDTASWHWIFFINLPMGLFSLFLVGRLVSEPSASEKERRELLERGITIDYIGFLLVALSLGCLEVVLDQGQLDDWFHSSLITAFAFISAISLATLIPWELTRKQPIVELRILGQRQFGICFFVMLLFGGIVVGTTVLIPQIEQTLFGYSALLAGLSLSYGGAALLLIMPIAGQFADRVQPRWLILSGLIVTGFAMQNLTNLTPDADFAWFAWARVYISLGLPFVFVSITSASYFGLKPNQSNQASGLINVARNLGGSIFVAMTQTVIQQQEQFHNSHLVQYITPTRPQYQDALRSMTQYFIDKGSSAAEASGQATAWIGQTIGQQAQILSYIDTFWLLSAICFVSIPIVLLLRNVKLGAGGPAH